VPEDWRGHSIGELDADMTLLVLEENQKLKKHFHL